MRVHEDPARYSIRIPIPTCVAGPNGVPKPLRHSISRRILRTPDKRHRDQRPPLLQGQLRNPCVRGSPEESRACIGRDWEDCHREASLL